MQMKTQPKLQNENAYLTAFTLQSIAPPHGAGWAYLEQRPSELLLHAFNLNQQTHGLISVTATTGRLFAMRPVSLKVCCFKGELGMAGAG